MRPYLFIGISLVLASQCFAAMQKGVIEVTAVKGPSNLINAKQQKAPLTRGLAFQEGNRVETLEKSVAELVLSNGSTLSVNPGTLMEVKTFSQVSSPLIVPGKFAQLSAEPSASIVQIEVYRGKIDGEVRKLNPNTQYTIKTPVGVVRVRGTVLSVAYVEGRDGKGRMQVTCTSGTVWVRANEGNASSIVGAGEATEVVGTPDNVVVMPNKPADINSDGVADVPVDSNGDGKADGVDVDGDGKIDNLVSTRPDGRLDGIDTNGDGVADSKIDIDGDGTPEIAIDGNGDGIPEAVVTVQEVVQEDAYVATPLTYPVVLDANGTPVTIEPVTGDLPPPPTPPPPAPPPPTPPPTPNGKI